MRALACGGGRRGFDHLIPSSVATDLGGAGRVREWSPSPATGFYRHDRLPASLRSTCNRLQQTCRAGLGVGGGGGGGGGRGGGGGGGGDGGRGAAGAGGGAEWGRAEWGRAEWGRAEW